MVFTLPKEFMAKPNQANVLEKDVVDTNKSRIQKTSAYLLLLIEQLEFEMKAKRK